MKCLAVFQKYLWNFKTGHTYLTLSRFYSVNENGNSQENGSVPLEGAIGGASESSPKSEQKSTG